MIHHAQVLEFPRKLFNTKQHGQVTSVTCPLDILRLIDQFVSNEMLHLIKWNHRALNHAAFHLADILSSDSADTPTPIKLPGLSPPIPNRRPPHPAVEHFMWSPIKSMSTKQFVLCLCALLVTYLVGMYTDW